jgi:hypothetical protein
VIRVVRATEPEVNERRWVEDASRHCCGGHFFRAAMFPCCTSKTPRQAKLENDDQRTGIEIVPLVAGPAPAWRFGIPSGARLASRGGAIESLFAPG